MEPIRKREFMIDYVLKLCLLVVLAALTVLCWPGGIFDTSLSMIPLGDWFWALVTGLVGGLTVLVAHCVIVEMVSVVFKTLRLGEASEQRDLVSGHE
jgi:hypothetical protein